MSAVTGIEWTDRTWNPVTGCTKVSPGCAHCYAEGIAKRLWPTTYPAIVERHDGKLIGRPRQFTDVQTHEDRLLEPLSWRKPSRVFVNSMSDLFHEDVPDAFIDEVFAVMAIAPKHTFQVLTKRPGRMRDYMDAANRRYEIELEMYAIGGDEDARTIPDARWPLPNVWLGVSVENQHWAEERIPLLLKTPAAVRFISAEPLLGPVALLPWALRGEPCAHNLHGKRPGCCDPTHLDWVIVGGESGTGARPFDLAWARSIVQQCQAAGVPVFVKQLGAHLRGSLTGCIVNRWEMPDGSWELPIIVAPGGEVWVAETRRDAVGATLYDRKGGDPAEWPDDLRVREFPEARA